MWTAAQKLHAAIRAPLGREIRRDDTIFVERPDWLQLITPSMPRGSGYLNEIARSIVPERDVERVIDDAIATYHGNGHPVKWCVGPWTEPRDFGARLERRGFYGYPVAGMGIATPGASRAIRPSPGIVVREVDVPEMPAFATCSCRGWGMDEREVPHEIHSHTRAITAEPRLTHFFVAALADSPGEVIGTAGIFVRPSAPESGSFGYLVGTQVLESARGRGAYRALVAARLALLAQRGIDYAITHARVATSAPILERLGFETIFRSSVYLLEAPGA